MCSDGGEYVLDRKFLDSYSYDIDYVVCPHKSQASARNSALLLSDADYVMFCDADDGFCNWFGIKIIFENINYSNRTNTPFDLLTTRFYCERTNDKGSLGAKNTGSDTITWGLTIGDHNSTFIHGRVYKREFLINNLLYFNEKLIQNEDSFFNICTNLYAGDKVKTLDVPIYCWRSTRGSVSNDPKFNEKFLYLLIHAHESIIETMQILKMNEKEIAKFTFNIICKVYLDMNRPCWYEKENDEYRDITFKTLQWYINKRGNLCNCLSDKDKKEILQDERKSPHYENIEGIAFNDFINFVMNYGKEQN